LYGEIAAGVALLSGLTGVILSGDDKLVFTGEVAEWSNAAVSKTV